MATELVPLEAPSLSAINIRSGVAPSSREFLNAANLANWLAGRGGQLIPAFCYGTLAGNTTKTLNLHVLPRKQALTRAWVISAYATSATPFVLTVTRGSFSQAFTFAQTRVDSAPAILYEPITSPTDTVGTATQLTLTLASSASSGAGFIDSISCFEVPRAVVVPGLDDGTVVLDRYRPGAPIHQFSVETLVDAVTDLAAISRRNGMYCWAVDVADCFSTTSTSYVPIFDLLKPAVLAAYTDAANGALDYINCKVYARSTVLGGTFRVTAASGDSNTINLTSSGAWVWNPGTINTRTVSVDTENLSVSDGRRSSRWDELTFELKAGTAGVAEIATICIGRHKQAT